MWSKFSQVAGLGPIASEAEEQHAQASTSAAQVPASDTQEQIEQQNLVIEQLKVILRENEKLSKEKNKELEDVSAKFQKFKLQSKAKIAHLTNQLKSQEKKDDGDCEDTSSSDSSERSNRGKVILLKKQLEQAKQNLEKKDKEIQEASKNFETTLNDLQARLNEKISKEESTKEVVEQTTDDSPAKRVPKDSNIQEMYAQIVYKDSKILDLNNQLLEQERRIMDLQECIKEKDEVLQSRNRAVQLMTADMNRKGKTVAEELDETRGQMRIMQENFADVETKWKQDSENLKIELVGMKEKFDSDLSEKDSKIKTFEENLKKLETARYELATKNAELQKKVVLVQERADNQCETYRKEIEEKLQTLKLNLESEKTRTTELQKALEETSNQSESKVLKARVKERTKLKALERELAAVKQLQDEKQKPEEITQLQQRVAVLEEEKGSLQLKLMEVDEQISMQEKMIKENSELQNILKENQEKGAYLEEQINQLQNEKSDIQSKFEEHKVLFEKLQKDFEETNKENIILSQNLNELTFTKDDLDNNIKHLMEKINQLAQENNEVSEKFLLLKDDKVALEMKVIELEEIREGDERVKEDLRIKVKKLEDAMNDESAPMFQLEKEKYELEERCLKLTELENSNQNHIKQLINEVNSLKKKLLEEENKHAILSNHNANLKEETKSLLAELNEHQENYSKLQSANEQVTLQFSEKEKEWKLIEDSCDDVKNQLVMVFSIASVNSIEEFEQKFKTQKDRLEKLKHNIEAEESEKEKLNLNLLNKEKENEQYAEVVKSLRLQLDDQQFCFQEEKDKLNNLIKEQMEDNEIMQTLVSEKDECLHKFKTCIEEKEEIIQGLNMHIEIKSEHLKSLEENYRLANNEISNLREMQAVETDKVQSKMSSLLDQISDLESELSRVQCERDSKDELDIRLQDEILNCRVEIENSTQAHHKKETFYQNALEEKNQMVENLQEQLSMSMNSLQEKENEVQQMLNDLDKKYKKAIEDMICEYETTIVNLKEAMLQSEKEKESLNKELSRKEEKLEQLTETSMKLKTAQQRISILENEISISHHSVSEKEEMCKTNAAAKMQLEFELSKLKEDISNLEAILHESTSKMENLKAENVEFQNQLLQKEQLITNQIQICENKLLDSRKALENAHLETCMLKNVSEELREELKNKEAILEDLKSNLKTKCSDFEELEVQKIELDHLMNEQKSVIVELKNNDIITKQDLKNSEDIIISYEKQIEDMAKKIDNLVNSIQTMKSETLLLETENKDKIQALQKELKNVVKEENVRNVAVNEMHSAEITNLKFELESCLQTLSNTTAELENHKATYEQSLHLTESLREDSLLHLNNEKTSNEKNILLNKENEKLQSSIISVKEELDKYISLTNILQEDIQTLKENTGKSKEELTNMMQETVNDNKHLKHANSTLSEQLQLIEQETLRVLDENHSLKTSGNEYEILIENLKNKIIQKDKEELCMENKFKHQMEVYEELLADYTKNSGHLDVLKKEYCSLADKVGGTDSNESELVLGSENMLQYFEKTQSKLFNFKSYMQSLEQKVNDFQSEVQNLKEENQLLQTDCNARQMEISSLLTLNESLIGQTSSVDKNLQILANETSEVANLNNLKLEKIITSLNLKHNKLEMMMSDMFLLEKEVTKFRSTIDALHVDKGNLLKENDYKSQLLLNLQDQKNELEKENLTLKTQCEEFHIQIKHSAEHVALLQASSSDHVQKISAELEVSHSQIQAVKCDLNEKHNELLILKEQLSTIENQNATLQSDIKNLGEQINHLKGEIESKNEEISIKREELKCSCVKNLALEDTLRRLTEEINILYEVKLTNEQNIAHREDKINELMAIIKEKDSSISKTVEDREQIIANFTKDLHVLEACKNTINEFQINNECLQAELLKIKEEKAAMQQNLKEKDGMQKSKESDQYKAAQNELESLKLDMEKCNSEKNNIAAECRNIQDSLMSVINQYDIAKEFIKCICDASSAAVCSGETDYTNAELILYSIDLTNVDFQTLAGQLQNQILEGIKLKKQMENEMKQIRFTLKNLIAEKCNVDKSLESIINENSKLSFEISALKENSQSPIAKNQGKSMSMISTLEAEKYEAETLQTRSSSDSTDNRISEDMKKENEALKQQLNMSKVKSDKMLIKLKIFKDKIDKLQSEVKEQTVINEKLSSALEENQELQKKLSIQNENQKKLQNNWHSSEKEKNLEIGNLNSLISQLKERNSLISSDCDRLRIELQEYKQIWEQSNASYELQREDNEHLRIRIKDSAEQIECLKAQLSDLVNNCAKIENDKLYLQQEAQNLREHADMLISDNDTFQGIIDKLKRSKLLLEQDLQKEKELYSKEIKSIENQYQRELEKFTSLKEVTDSYEIAASQLQKEYQQLRLDCEALQLKNNVLEEKIENYSRDKKLVEESNISIQNEMLHLKKNEHLDLRSITDHTYSTDTQITKEDKSIQSDYFEAGDANFSSSTKVEEKPNTTAGSFEIQEKFSAATQSFQLDINNLTHEKRVLESQLNNICQELQSANIRNTDAFDMYVQSEARFKEDFFQMESNYKQQIFELKSQLKQIIEVQNVAMPEELYEINSRLERELNQAMSSLHRQGLRCEELSLEVSKLLEERNGLRMKLSQYQQQLHQIQLKQSEYKKEDSQLLRNAPNSSEDELTCIKIELPSEKSKQSPISQVSYVKPDQEAEIAILHQRLLESEKTCQELRRVNDALDTALVTEQEQRKLIEEELGYTKDQIIQEKSPKDEYHLLLGDFDEPEMFVETNFSISRKVKTHAHKLRRWVTGRRSYLHRMCQRKKYSELLYLVYFCAVHLWLMICLFKHS